MPFDLTLEWILERIEAGRCELTGIRFDLSPISQKQRINPFSPSVDRVKPGIGYTMDNCRVVATAMNIALGAWGELVFEHLAASYLKQLEA